MVGSFSFPGKVFNGKKYELHGVYLERYSLREAHDVAKKLRQHGWLARVASARRDTKGGKRVGYVGVYKRAK